MVLSHRGMPEDVRFGGGQYHDEFRKGRQMHENEEFWPQGELVNYVVVDIKIGWHNQGLGLRSS